VKIGSAGANSWTRGPWHGRCSPWSPALGGWRASGIASEPEQIGQAQQAVTNSAYVPSGYYCKSNDEFGGDFGGNQANSNIDSTKWGFQNTNVNNEAQNYTTRQCSANPSDWNYCVHNGALTIQARNIALDCSNTGNAACADMILNGTESGAPSKGYTSGRMTSKTKSPFQKQYGYIEFKARLPFQVFEATGPLAGPRGFGRQHQRGPGSAGGTAALGARVRSLGVAVAGRVQHHSEQRQPSDAGRHDGVQRHLHRQ
jgi:hypothetical protein